MTDLIENLNFFHLNLLDPVFLTFESGTSKYVFSNVAELKKTKFSDNSIITIK